MSASSRHVAVNFLRRSAPAGLLVAVWALFFWRMLTPAVADRLMLEPSASMLSAFAARDTALRGLTLGGPSCVSALAYPPALAIVGLSALAGASSLSWRLFELEAMGHVLFALLTMFAFLRARDLRSAASVFGAIAFAFGSFFAWVGLGDARALAAAAWLPLAMLGGWRMVTRGGWGWAALAALSLSMAWLAGSDVMALMGTLLFVGAYFVWLPPSSRVPTALSTLVIALVVVAAFASFSLTVGSSVLSGRAPEVEAWRLAYGGVMAFGFALLPWLVRRATREQLVWLVVALACLVATLFAGGQLEVMAALALTWSLALASALGLNATLAPILARDRVRLRRLARVVWLACGAVFVVVIALAVLLHLQVPAFKAFDAVTDRLALALLALCGFAAALTLRFTRPNATWLFGALAVGLLVFELFSAHHFVHMTKPTRDAVALPALAASCAPR